MVAVGENVRCVLTAADAYGNPLRGPALAALGELHRMGGLSRVPPYTHALDASASEAAVEFVATGTGSAGVVLVMPNASQAGDIVPVVVRGG